VSPWSLSPTWPPTSVLRVPGGRLREELHLLTVDLRGAGLSGKPEAATAPNCSPMTWPFMQAAGVERAHVSGLSLGAATGIWLAAKYRSRCIAVPAQRLAGHWTPSCARWSRVAGHGAGLAA